MVFFQGLVHRNFVKSVLITYLAPFDRPVIYIEGHRYILLARNYLFSAPEGSSVVKSVQQCALF